MMLTRSLRRQRCRLSHRLFQVQSVPHHPYHPRDLFSLAYHFLNTERLAETEDRAYNLFNQPNPSTRTALAEP
jgi:hypothetical protein